MDCGIAFHLGLDYPVFQRIPGTECPCSGHHFLSPMQFSPLPRVAASNQRKIAFFTKFAGPQPNITRQTICVGCTNEKGATQSQ